MTKIGIDAGGSLIKIAYESDEGIQYIKFEATDLDHVVNWMNDYYPDAKVCLTGGKGAILQSILNREDYRLIVEFEATVLGIKHHLKELGVDIDRFILTNVGTGTSIHYVHTDTNIRVGGTGVGGGTLIGLSILLTEIDDYSNIVSQAKQGKRDGLDLKVQEIYEGAEPPILGDLTASNFGSSQLVNASRAKQEDLLATVIGLVGETVATTSVLAAGQFGVSEIVYIGSTFINNECLRGVVAEYTRYKGAKPIFVQNGEYSGAVGALLSI